MTKTLRRTLIILTMLTLLGALAFPAWAKTSARQTAGTHTVTGSYKTTNPIYPTIGADTGIILYDFTGEITRDFDFRSPSEAQVIGELKGDIVSGTYSITLPDTPKGVFHDFDGDPSTPAAVQVFTPATYINYLGDQYVNRGESPLDLSARLQPMTYNVIGGTVLVWSAKDGEKFPAGLGPDGAAFTADDPLMSISAGWSVVSLDSDPFKVTRDASVDVPIIESFGGLNDYSSLSYTDAWEKFFQRTKETYPFTADKHLDWDAIYAEITPLVKMAKTDIDFHLVIARLGELLPDTHFGYVSMQVMQQYMLGGVGIGRLVVTDDNEVVVVKVAAGSVAQQAGIQPGDLLIDVEGTPALQALDQTPLLISSASTLHGRRFIQGATMLQGPIGSTVKLTWRDASGQDHTQTLTRTPDMTALLDAFEGAVSGDVISSKMLDSGVGYIRVRSFAEDVSKADAEFTSALKGLMDQGAKGIILDVRDNGGGLVELSMSMTGHFFPDYKHVFDIYYADGTGSFAYRGREEVLVNTPYYDGPVAVLVNEMTVSAGDLFAYTMQLDHRAIVVGFTPTSGAVGEVGDGQYLLPGGLQTQVPTGRPVDPVTGKTIIEGTGVIPDIRVPLTHDAVLSPDDEVLIAAEKAILGK